MSVVSSLVKTSCTALMSITGLQSSYGSKATEAACNLIQALQEGKEKDVEKPSVSSSFLNFLPNLSSLGNSFDSVKKFFVSKAPEKNTDAPQTPSSKKPGSSDFLTTLSSLGDSFFQSTKNLFSPTSETSKVPETSKIPEAGKISETILDLSNIKGSINDLSTKIKFLGEKFDGFTEIFKRNDLSWTNQNQKEDILKKLREKYDDELLKLIKKSERLNSLLQELIDEKLKSKREKKEEKYKQKSVQYVTKLREVNFLNQLILELS